MAPFDGLLGLGQFFGGYRAKLSGGQGPLILGGGASSAGKTVTPDSAMHLATVWACIRLLSETIGTLPLGVYTKDKTGKRNPAQDHGLYTLLHDSPNYDQTAVEFWEAIVACLGLWGNGYAEKIMRDDKSIISLNFLRPDATSVYRAGNGSRRYRCSDPRASKTDLSEDEIFHVRGFGIGIDAGLSPISFARQTLGSAMAADEAAAVMFRQGLQLSGGVVKSGQATLKAQQRTDIREMLEKFAGSENAGRFIVLEAGMEVSALGIDPVDAQMLESRAFSVEEICRWYRVPPFMVGHSEKSTSWGTGLEQQMIGFLTFSLNPYLVRIEQAVRKQLMTPSDVAQGVYAEFNLDGLLRADTATRMALYSIMGQNGLASRDELRAKENLAEIPGGGGKTYTVQSNLVDLNKLGEAPAAQTPADFGMPPKPPKGSGDPSPPAAAAA